MKGQWQAVGLIAAALALACFWALAASVPRALAACGGGDDGFAEFYGPYAQTIVLGRYEKLEAAPTPAAPHVVEPGGENVAVIRVLHVYRGSADETVEVDPDVLGDCTAPTEEGERIVLAFIVGSPDGSFVGSWHEDDRGRWWHHFDRYRDLPALLTALGVPPDTATLIGGGGGHSAPTVTSLALLAAIGLTATTLLLSPLGWGIASARDRLGHRRQLPLTTRPPDA